MFGKKEEERKSDSRGQPQKLFAREMASLEKIS
jgi:hypothetical protein